ncbi:MAG: hypothetical protein JST75_01495 [Bacteroidetes bacterium]|nr:hypothetical protein [Bacteroidota bacterium]
MKKIFTMIFGVVLMCMALPSMAQREGKLVSVGFGIEPGIPVGSAADIFNFNMGFTARVSVHAGPGFATFTSGGIVMIPKNIDQNNSFVAGVQIPFKAGYKYIIARHFFVMGELGYSIYKSYYDSGSNSNLASTSTGGFTYAPSIGVNFGVTELALRYESINLSGDRVDYMGLRIGFNF